MSETVSEDGKVPKELSDAYQAGWAAAQKAGDRDGLDGLTRAEGEAFWAWCMGYDDCKRGVINAQWYLGPELLVGGEASGGSPEEAA